MKVVIVIVIGHSQKSPAVSRPVSKKKNNMKKTIIYLHGYGSSGLSNTVSYLRKLMPDCEVIAPDIPVDPKEALPFLRLLCET